MHCVQPSAIRKISWTRRWSVRGSGVSCSDDPSLWWRRGCCSPARQTNTQPLLNPPCSFTTKEQNRLKKEGLEGRMSSFYAHIFCLKPTSNLGAFGWNDESGCWVLICSHSSALRLPTSDCCGAWKPESEQEVGSKAANNCPLFLDGQKSIPIKNSSFP